MRRSPRLARLMPLGLGLLVLAGSPVAASEVRVEVKGTQVDLTATAAPVSEVLDHLARATGMKLVFEGATPRSPVTLSVRGRSPRETVLAVLEGLGINYALIADPTGVRVQTLLLTGTGPAAASSSRGAAAYGGQRRNMPIRPEADVLGEDVEPPLEEPGLPAGEEEPPEVPESPGPAENPSDLSAAPEPPATPTPTYSPGPFLPRAPNTVQPFQPFPAPAPTPTAPAQSLPGRGPETHSP